MHVNINRFPNIADWPWVTHDPNAIRDAEGLRSQLETFLEGLVMPKMSHDQQRRTWHLAQHLLHRVEQDHETLVFNQRAHLTEHCGVKVRRQAESTPHLTACPITGGRPEAVGNDHDRSFAPHPASEVGGAHI